MNITLPSLEELYSDATSALAVISPKAKISTIHELLLYTPKMLQFQGLGSFVEDIQRRLGAYGLALRDENVKIEDAVVRRYGSVRSAPVHVLNFSIRDDTVKVRPLKIIKELTKASEDVTAETLIDMVDADIHVISFGHMLDEAENRTHEWNIGAE